MLCHKHTMFLSMLLSVIYRAHGITDLNPLYNISLHKPSFHVIFHVIFHLMLHDWGGNVLRTMSQSTWLAALHSEPFAAAGGLSHLGGNIIGFRGLGV